MLIVVSVYGVHRYGIVFLYYRHRKNLPKTAGTFEQLPVVTVQLPMFNERSVARRIIEKACEIDYPKDRLQIQVLDDSTDSTRPIAEQAVADAPGQGLRHRVHPSRGPHRLQGRGAGPRDEDGQGRVHHDLRRRFRARPDDSPAVDQLLHRSLGLCGADPLGPSQSQRQPADPLAGDFAGRPFRHRARGPQPQPAVHEFQRHGRHVASARPSTTRAVGSTTR